MRGTYVHVLVQRSSGFREYRPAREESKKTDRVLGRAYHDPDTANSIRLPVTYNQARSSDGGIGKAL